jgi:hypothetical protein
VLLLIWPLARGRYRWLPFFNVLACELCGFDVEVVHAIEALASRRAADARPKTLAVALHAATSFAVAASTVALLLCLHFGLERHSTALEDTLPRQPNLHLVAFDVTTLQTTTSSDAESFLREAVTIQFEALRSLAITSTFALVATSGGDG